MRPRPYYKNMWGPGLRINFLSLVYYRWSAKSRVLSLLTNTGQQPRPESGCVNIGSSGTPRLISSLTLLGSASLTHRGIRSIELKKSNQQLSWLWVIRGEVILPPVVGRPPSALMATLSFVGPNDNHPFK